MEFGKDVDLSENNPIVFAFHRSDGPLVDFSVTVSWIMQLKAGEGTGSERRVMKCQMLLKQILIHNVLVFFS